MKKVKVLNIIWSMGDGGAQRIILNYLKAFNNDKDIDFKLLVYDKCNDSYCNKVIKENNYNVEYLGLQKSVFRHIPIVGKKINLHKIKRTIKNALIENKPDIVHVHISPMLCYALDPIVECNIPIRFDTLHSNPLRFVGEDLKNIRNAFQKHNFIPICLNEEQKNMAKKYYGFKKFEIVRNGIDIEKIKSLKISKLEARRNLNIDKNSFVVIGVGRLNKIKRFDLLIKSFNEVLKKEKNAKLLIAGDGEELNSLKELVESLNIIEYVTFLGNIENIVELYCAADVLAMTSESEASPLTLLEAQICNLRCVISSGVPNGSIVTNKVKKMKKNASISEWSKALLDKEYKGRKILDIKSYDEKEVLSQMKNTYLKYWKEYNERKK